MSRTVVAAGVIALVLALGPTVAGWASTIRVRSIRAELWCGGGRAALSANGDRVLRLMPTQVAETTWSKLDVGLPPRVRHEDRHIAFGQLGLGDTTGRTSPAQVGSDTWTTVGMHYFHAWRPEVTAPSGAGGATAADWRLPSRNDAWSPVVCHST